MNSKSDFTLLEGEKVICEFISVLSVAVISSLTFSSLESLPNELLLMIIAHLSSPDLLQAFYGLNHRFNLMVRQSARRFTIPEDIPGTRLDEYTPEIRNAIERLCFDVQLLPQVFRAPHFYLSLHSVVLRCANFATVALTVDGNSAARVIHSCLDVLRACDILPIDWMNDDWFHASEHRLEPREDVQVRILRFSPLFITQTVTCSRQKPC